MKPGEASPVTALLIDGESSVGTASIQRYLTPATGYVFKASLNNSTRTVTFTITQPSSAAPVWTLRFRAPVGETLSVGEYAPADYKSSTAAGIDVVHGGSACSVRAGRFAIHQLDLSDGVQNFAASFEVHCASAVAAVFGELRYQSTGIPLSALIADRTSVDVGTPGSSASFSVTNPGTTTQAMSMSVRGAHAADFRTSPSSCTSVGAGGSCTVAVNFDTAESGARTAQLVIFDGTRRGHRVIELRGTGRAGTSVALSASPVPISAGAPLTLRATVASGGGTVEFLGPGGVLASAPVGALKTATAVINLPAGSHWIVASASGSGYGRSESAPLFITVND